MTMATMPQVAPPQPPAPPSGQRAEHIYPTLTPVQLARIAAHGRRRHVARGEVLVQAGEQNARLFVLVAGREEGGKERPLLCPLQPELPPPHLGDERETLLIPSLPCLLVRVLRY